MKHQQLLLLKMLLNSNLRAGQNPFNHQHRFLHRPRETKKRQLLKLIKLARNRQLIHLRHQWNSLLPNLLSLNYQFNVPYVISAHQEWSKEKILVNVSWNLRVINHLSSHQLLLLMHQHNLKYQTVTRETNQVFHLICLYSRRPRQKDPQVLVQIFLTIQINPTAQLDQRLL